MDSCETSGDPDHQSKQKYISEGTQQDLVVRDQRDLAADADPVVSFVASNPALRTKPSGREKLVSNHGERELREGATGVASLQYQEWHR